jgi:maltooligosyltrehalose trehalohydrolase
MTAEPLGTPAFRFGPRHAESGTVFGLWAPSDKGISLEIDGVETTSLARDGDGFRSAVASAGAGARYRFAFDTGERVPDPASRAQAGDIAGESLVPDPSRYRWQCNDWRGRGWEETVLYELHVGLLGGFDGVAQHLERLAEIGVTAIELMPIADFPGQRNWGYDGVLPFAPDSAYGTPDELKALIDRAHALGLMVFLDVVYNHFGPEGNWLGVYAPRFFREDIHTPWGSAIDFRQPMVRRFFLENALYWLHEFRIDGLRFDAVHAIADRDWLPELAGAIRASVPSDRHVHLVVENDNNDSSLMTSGFNAQWNDDWHHALHVLLTGERDGYYADYARAPAEALARILAEGFAYQGEPSEHRGGEKRGTPSGALPPTAFVSFLQNHDQIGNRAFGERLVKLAKPGALRAAIALLLLSPQIPLIFMGEETGAEEPFLYFTDFQAELADAVREGRRAEFAQFPAFADASVREQIPDPNAPSTFETSRPSFAGRRAQDWSRLYTSLLKIRRERIVPHLRGAKSLGAQSVGDAAIIARWRLANGDRLTIAGNFGDVILQAAIPQTAPVWGVPSDALPPFTTLVWIEP